MVSIESPEKEIRDIRDVINYKLCHKLYGIFTRILSLRFHYIRHRASAQCRAFVPHATRRKEVFLFNDALNTFSYGYMESDIW